MSLQRPRFVLRLRRMTLPLLYTFRCRTKGLASLPTNCPHSLINLCGSNVTWLVLHGGRVWDSTSVSSTSKRWEDVSGLRVLLTMTGVAAFALPCLLLFLSDTQRSRACWWIGSVEDERVAQMRTITGR